MIQFSMKALKADQVKGTDVLHQNILKRLSYAHIDTRENCKYNR